MAITLDELIKVVQASADDDLTQLEVAAQRARELGELGDSLLNHFVDRSRRSGHTWAEIGEHLGVTRQAAQKRFVDTAGASITFERFTLRARSVLDHAEEAARAMQHGYIGTEHLLLALWGEPDGVAAKVLDILGVERGALAKHVLSVIGRGPTPVSGRPPFTPRAAKVLEEAINASQDLGHNYQGTEHILLGLYRGQDGLANQWLRSVGATPEKVRDEVVKMLAGF
jgi:hypothetical protein